MKSKREYIIPFIGLKLGFHEFEFQIRDAFFEGLEYSIIHHGEVNVKLVLEKKETMLIAEFYAEGQVSTDCDRCNDPIDVPVKGTFRLIYKFGHESSNDESLIVLHPDAYELDVRDAIYELITISLPPRAVHPPGECNEEMIELLSQYSLQEIDSGEEDDFDPDDDDWEDENWEDEEDEDEWEDGEDDDPDDDDDRPIDPRWAALKNLN